MNPSYRTHPLHRPSDTPLIDGLRGELHNMERIQHGGGVGQLIVQAIAAFGVLIYSFVAAYAIGFAIEKTIGFRVKNEDEIAGIDTVVHGEEGYALVD